MGRPLTAFPSLLPVPSYTSVHCQCPTMTCFDKSNWNPLYKLPAIASGGVSERESVNGETIRMHIYHRNSAASGPTEEVSRVPLAAAARSSNQTYRVDDVPFCTILYE